MLDVSRYTLQNLCRHSVAGDGLSQPPPGRNRNLLLHRLDGGRDERQLHKGVEILNSRRNFATAGATVLLLWILFSLLAIAYIGDRSCLGLTIALAGGVIIGLVSMWTFESKPQRRSNEKRQ